MTEDQKSAAAALIALAKMVVEAHERGLLVAKSQTLSGSVDDMMRGLATATKDAEHAVLADRRR